jgi:PhnB protein
MPAKVKPIPRDMHTVTPSLTIAGCAKAIDFYKRALGAEELDRYVGPDGKSVWHAALKIGDSVVFMNDEIEGMTGPAPGPGRPSPIRLWLYLPDCDAAFNRAVDAGARSKRKPEDMFWGDRTAAVADPFGYEWELATHVKDMSKDETRRAADEFARKMASGE